MRTIELDIRNIHTVRALHVYLRYMLRLAPHYGANLDALHDALCEESEQTRIVLRTGEGMSEEMTSYLLRLVSVFTDAAQENDRLRFDLR
ncbi:MAG: barstar family protein [Clostridiales bacterium]|nr:barstar family protein [Clostridiales bacterium]